MINKIKTILFILLLALFWLPFIQESTHWFKEPALTGAFVKPAKPVFSIDSLRSLQFQKRFEDYENYNFGFRGFLVKLKNSLEYILFRKSNAIDIVEGKDGYFFSISSIDLSNGRYYSGKEHNEDVVSKIKFLKESLAKRGAHLLVVMGPSKEKVMPEKLPDQYKGVVKKNNNYDDIVQGFAKYNIPFIDFNTCFNKILDTCKTCPLFTTTGFHWSIYGSTLAQDSILKYMEHNLTQPMPAYKYAGMELSDTARNPDADFEGPMNLFFKLNQPKYMYPKLEMIPSGQNVHRPKVIVIGDSYFSQIREFKCLSQVFSGDSKFWYYFTTSYLFPDKTGMPVNNADVIKDLNSAEYVLLVGSNGTLDRFPYGVTDFYFDNVGKTNIETCIGDNIKNTPDWMREMLAIAASKNKPVEEIVAAEAERISKEKQTVHLQAANNKYVCAENNNLVIANRDYAGAWETFYIVHLRNNECAVYSYKNEFLSADLHSKSEITAAKPYIGAWEKFTVVGLGNELVAIKAANGKYLSPDEKSDQLIAQSTSIGKLEKFKMIIK